ncbi:hypothetical protein BZA05DRAFT_445787 [Tricharina praecox]|uniref:uncharacterized protein n=1 Tax=Tricharina praecox TaxID=43433 RepID=UPI0022206864|nr:uncharacterized protein BZA05DRAFT_445787 [Tricharina praecox]KAI5850062.1 hypothetical protein BZA05DRAFT_445787 [Tricharina praecox]
MRLHLTIHRPFPLPPASTPPTSSTPASHPHPVLPPTKLLWTHSPSPSSCDLISDLLTQISAIIPLELAGHGLEDYVVELDGFEVLHFAVVSGSRGTQGTLRDGDEVVVRPLRQAEIRARKLTGRCQITTSGRRVEFQQTDGEWRNEATIEGIPVTTLARWAMGSDEEEDEEDSDFEPGKEEESDEGSDEDEEELGEGVEEEVDMNGNKMHIHRINRLMDIMKDRE